MNETMQTVNSLIAYILFGKPFPDLPASLNWDSLFKECMTQSVATLFTDILDDLPLSDELRLKWRYVCLKGKQHSLSILKIQNEIHGLFSSEKIGYAVLKGFAAAQYYSKYEYRSMGDLDIIVAPSDFERAQNILEKHEYESALNPNHFDPRHVPYVKGGVEIELHLFFAETKDGNAEDCFFNSMIEKALEHVVEKQYHIPEDGNVYLFNVLPDLENGLILLKHIIHHIPTGIGYRQALDFMVFADTYLDDFVWNNGFSKLVQKLHMEKLAKTCVRMGQLYFGMGEKITWCNDIDENTCTELLEFLMESGNFGRKDESGDERITQVLRITRGSPFLLLKHEQQKGLKYWKAAKKHPILRPFAWIYGCCRHLKMLTEEKKMGEVFHKLPARKDSASISKTLGINR